MEPTAEEVAAHFADLEDAPLLATAEERDELTDASQALLLGEMERRGLAVPAVMPRADAPAYDARTWVTVERFRDLSAGLVARGALEAAGVPCFLRDENTVRLDWQISNFIGGMRLQVQPDDEALAREVLAGIAQEGDPVCDTGAALENERCPVCGSAHISREQRWRGLSLLTVWMFGVPLAVRKGTPVWRCETCGETWKDAE